MSTIKNVDAFEKLLGLCSGYGESYDPGRPNLQKDQLTLLLRNAREALLKVHQAKTEYQNATNQREVLFELLRTLAPRVLFELRASGALQQTIRDAQTTVRYAVGRGPTYRTPLPREGAEPAPGREARGTDFGSRVGHFEKLLQILATEKNYRPVMVELRVGALQAFLGKLRQANGAVIAATVNWQMARKLRNEVVYTGTHNLVDTARAVKHHLRALFGTGNDAYRAAVPIKFTKK